MKKLMMAVVAVCAAVGTFAATLTVKNFDEDLATVYVNDEPTTNGQVVAVDGSAKIELKDFRNDYYFRYAPESQADRSMALDCWEGVPEGYEDKNPATFDIDGDLTITANVDVKGYAWQYATIDNVKQITNHVHRWKWSSADAVNRTVVLSSCLTNLPGTAENNLVCDLVERVRYNDRNYTVTGYDNRKVLNGSRIGTLALSPRFSSFPFALTDGSTAYSITNLVGMSDIKALTVGGYAFYYSGSAFSGPVTNFVALRSTSVGGCAYQGRGGMTGELLLERVTDIGGNAFYNCTGLTAARLTSPYLTTVGDNAFAGCSNMKEVSIGSSALTTMSTSAFNAKTVTNFIFLADAPESAALDNLIASAASADGAHACRLTVDAGRSNWWKRVTAPSDAEVAAGLPANCMGAYVDAGKNRRAWVVSSVPLSGVLLVGDMTMLGMDGYVPRTGLEIGSQVTLTAPAGFDSCELQHLKDGNVWTTYETVNATSFAYTHEGEITRAVWRVDGATLNTFVNNYGGGFEVELLSGTRISDTVFSKGAVVRLKAKGRATHPTSHFIEWTEGVTGDGATNDTVLVTMDADKTLRAEFYPDEWLYNPTTKKITDGEWTCDASVSGSKITASNFTGGQNYILWLDISLPVHNETAYETTYAITSMSGARNTTLRKVRVGELFESFPSEFFRTSPAIERVDGLGASRMTTLSYCLFYEGSGGPIKNEIYEANDIIPVNLTRFSNYCWGWGPYLTGTLEFAKLKNFGVTDDAVEPFLNYTGLRNKLYHSTVDGRVIGVTNLLLTCEDLAIFPKDLFASAHLESVTIASTNLTTAASQAFTASSTSLKELVFLAHAPAAAAFENLVKASVNTNTVIYCSKFAPGWKELRMKGYSSSPEWPARPAGCWGMYQTTDGKKRFYLVQKDSKYDKRNGFSVLVK